MTASTRGADIKSVAQAIAVVVVRSGQLPLGGAETVAEAGGSVVLIGDKCTEAVESLVGIAQHITVIEAENFAPTQWSSAIVSLVRDADVVLLPGSPDGRDLAPRLAMLLGRPLLTGAVEIRSDGAVVAREGGLVMDDLVVDGPFVATLQPGVRGLPSISSPSITAAAPRVDIVERADLQNPELADQALDATVIEVIPPDPATMDLAEAARIVGGGAGLGSPEAMSQLGLVADALGCSTGGTRVITDWGWLPFERQIGTTGVSVHPRLYLAFGVSGAVQHVAGLGDPDHVIAVNIDASCPMMSLADLAIVTDAPALVAELARRLGVSTHD